MLVKMINYTGRYMRSDEEKENSTERHFNKFGIFCGSTFMNESFKKRWMMPQIM